MIEVLTNYISEIQKQFSLEDFVDGPVNGLHILLEVEDGEVKLIDKELYQPKKGEEITLSKFLRKDCLPKEMHIDYLESHKALIGKEGKKIHSASPFAIKFRKKSFDEEWKSWFPKKQAPKEIIKVIEEKERQVKNSSDQQKVLLNHELIKLKIDSISLRISELVGQYFKKANKVCAINYEMDGEFEIVQEFQKYCELQLPALLKNMVEDIIQLNKNDDIIILNRNISTKLYEEANSNYIKDYIFNVNYFNEEIAEQTYGLSGYLNTASDKKPYLRHLTTPFEINLRIPQEKALLLNTFERYRKNEAFKTNPLPIFIDQSELNNEVINVVKAEGNQVSFHKIIHTLFEHKKADLGNYYLFYFWRGELKDVDFVSGFNFYLDVKLKNIIPRLELEKEIPIKNIFDFEHKIIQSIFNNLLIQKRKDGTIWYRYFDEIDNNPKYNTTTTWNLTMKYRKAFYDFIYKSRRQSVTSSMFHDIMEKGILDDILHDEYKEKKHTKQSDIYNKLNIWFSFWDFFGKNKTDELTMANRIVQLQESLRKLFDSVENSHIQTDDEFAFAAGQIIYFLLNQSKAGNKTHALLEPFLQKTNQKEFKKAIANTFNAYKHEIYFGKSKFEKICGEIMGYELEGSLKELMPVILAGYFSDSIIYQK